MTPAQGFAGRGRHVRGGLLAVVRFYQRAVSPALPPRCRFVPTCSAYAAEAIERHGAARGSWLALRRLLKCAPWHPGGVDLVPPAAGTDRSAHSSSTTAPSPAPVADPSRPDRAAPPALGRTPQQEAGVV